ncbi:MAG: sodium:calcium antiporter, partial [Halobacteriovoraceae bacterium]|nr:sodium:calcium antiporter [Halobacteriovoraceae bacterium]
MLILAIFFLYLGAELTLESSEKIGKHFGLSPLVIGLLIVGFGTSLPEFFVSQLATYRGHPEIALGNIIGSNIANIFLIMGVASLLVPLHLNRKEITRQ